MAVKHTPQQGGQLLIEFHNDEIEELQKKIAEEHGYELQDHSLVLYVTPKAD